MLAVQLDPSLLPQFALKTPSPSSPRFIDLGTTQSTAAGDVQLELTHGLVAESARVAPKFFYDALGCRLFEAITELDEYYPTRTEAGIFQAWQTQMAAAIASSGIRHACLIDLGAGNCVKAEALIPQLLPRQYVPVDISNDFLRASAERVQASFPALDIVGVGMDFSSQMVLPDAVHAHDRVFFYPGSSLGNFSPVQSLAFLQQISHPAQGAARGLLLGIDLVKDSATLEAAYDDALGVTAAFNKNLLRHVNALLGSDFDERQWRHVALFDTAHSRIEMHLQATHDLTVRWPGHTRRFSAGERIHTEHSYKYTLEAMTTLLRQAGFSHVEHWTDANGWFGVFWAAM
jgi:dimethylhistidine N-methyltransferase